MHAVARAPSLLISVLGFVLLGPLMLGVVFAAVLGEADSIAVMPAGWWGLGVAAGPTGWLLTLIPTVLAAVLFWVTFKNVLRLFPSIGRNRPFLITSSAVTGAAMAVAAWVMLQLGLTGQIQSFLFTLLLPVGLLVGLLLGLLARAERR